jgi:hypothetical protein
MIWLVDFPTYQYNEDVRDLASKAGLQIIDSRFKDSFTDEQLVSAKDAPKLTKKK